MSHGQCPCAHASGWRSENAFFAPFYSKNDPFTKTGSGQT
jgi:hypothetical protein